MKRSAALLAMAAVTLPNRVRGQSPVKLTVASPPGTGVTPALYALKAGIFRKYGLDVDFQKMTSGAAIQAAVAGGSVQIGSGSATSVITAYAHGLPLQFVCGGAFYEAGNRVPYQMLLVGKTSTIKIAADLNGKTLGLQVACGDLAAMSTQAWVEKHGGDWQSIHILEIPQSAMAAAVEQGRIDGMSMGSPGSTIALASGKVRILADPFEAVAKRFSIAPWFAATAWVKANPDIVQRFDRAMSEASAYANSHPKEMLPLLAAYSGVDPEVIESAARAPFIVPLGPADFQPLIDVMLTYKVIDKTLDPNDLIAATATRR
jgi:ABC-type nitrate/sulfonate/bicarbonate transport system substrate-binding protein